MSRVVRRLRVTRNHAREAQFLRRRKRPPRVDQPGAIRDGAPQRLVTDDAYLAVSCCYASLLQGK